MTQTNKPSDMAPASGATDPVEYDKWFRSKVRQSIDDPRPSIPHDQVMAEMDALIKEKNNKTK